MAIFGMNGLTFLALDLALVFAVYGMKEVALTKNQVTSVGRVLFRKQLGDSKEKNAEVARAAREQVIRSMEMKGKRYSTTAPQKEAYLKKTWLR